MHAQITPNKNFAWRKWGRGHFPLLPVLEPRLSSARNDVDSVLEISYQLKFDVGSDVLN